MAISQAMCTSFKVELMTATHNFTYPGGDTFKIALYQSTANLGASTTAYTTSGECPSTGNYTAGGNTLVGVTPTSSGTTAYTDFDPSTWSNATITANGALIYNSSQSNKAVCVLAFGGDKTSTNGDFTIVFPTANGALIYNSSQSNKAVCVLAFGGDKTSTNGDFTIVFPTADATNAIIRITS